MIDSGDFVRRGRGGVFKACVGAALTIDKLDRFEAAYFDPLEKLCKRHGLERKRMVYKSYDILSSLQFKDGLIFLNELFDGLADRFVSVDFYYSYLFTDKVPVVKLYGVDKSGVEEMKPVEFMNKLSPSYPHCCAWKYVNDYPDVDVSFHLDHFEGEVTLGWELIKDRDVNVYLAGDEMYPCLAMADVAVELLDRRLYQAKASLFPKHIVSCFKELKGRLHISYLGQKYLRYITPIKKQKIDTLPKLKRPLIFVLKEYPPGFREESQMVRASPLWNRICDFAYQKRGTVKFVDPNSKEDRRLLLTGGLRCV
ncbi:MAG: hypothetical protein QMD23_02430 [Candidatus Bathyarchaeia archaeon]|nr:hypothetical protein [Candidatus Bathyarchaeia archaeon]